MTATHIKQLSQLKELFSDTYDESDLLAVLEDVGGDLQLAIDRISEGNISTWSVSTKQPHKKLNKSENLFGGSGKVEKLDSGLFLGLFLRLGKAGSYRGGANSTFTSTRGGRGARGGRGRGGRGGYSNSDRNHTGHGGEKSLGKFTAPSAEPAGDSWNSSVPATGTDDWGNTAIKTSDDDWGNTAVKASDDDWGNTAVKASDEDWGTSDVHQDLMKETSKLSITKKGFTVVKAKNNLANNGPKKSNWASIVKGPDPPPPVPAVVVAEKTVTPPVKDDKKSTAKKLTLVKKDSNLQQTLAPQQPQILHTSPLIERSTELSPVIASHLPVKSSHDKQRALSPVPATAAPISQQQEYSAHPNLPPGLGVGNSAASAVTTRQQTQQKPVSPRKIKHTSPVVMPMQPNSSGPTASVQFGSFGLTKPAAATSTGTDPIKSPDRSEEPTNAFQFNPPQSTSTATQSSRPASASASTNETAVPASQMSGAPGLPGQHYQQQQFGLGGINYSMYETEQQRVMGYYGMPDPVQPTYAATKYGQPDSSANATQSPATQHAQAANPAAHLPQQSFQPQPYPYYPYYMNQYQQAPYQQPVYQQQHFGGAKYGAAGFQASTASSNSGKAAQSGTQAAQNGAGVYTGYGAQQFYPNSYEEQDYSKSNTYGQQNFSFGGQAAKSEYKSQNRTRPPYEKQSSQSNGASGASGQQASNAQQPQTTPTPYGYANAQQYPGMQYPFMMHPAQGYPQNPGYQGRGYWSGNQ